MEFRDVAPGNLLDQARDESNFGVYVNNIQNVRRRDAYSSVMPMRSKTSAYAKGHMLAFPVSH
jgi:hypothetical protein